MTEDLRPCAACRRHVAVASSTCVFCGASLAPSAPRPTVVGRASRAAIFAGALALAPACGSQLHYEPLPATATSSSTGEVKGRLTDHDGRPAVGAYVTLYGEALRATTRGDSTSVQTNATGSFTFTAVPPGKYWIGISGLGESPKLEVRAGQAAVLTLELAKPQPPHRHMAKPYGAPPARRRLV